MEERQEKIVPSPVGRLGKIFPDEPPARDVAASANHALASTEELTVRIALNPFYRHFFAELYRLIVASISVRRGTQFQKQGWTANRFHAQ